MEPAREGEREGGSGRMMLASLLPMTGGVAFLPFLLGALLVGLGPLVRKLTRP
jgi:hypothetical protein